MTIHVTDIKWDTTDKDGEPLPKKWIRKLNLPKVVDVEVEDDENDLDDRICDYLSDTYGFCVKSFCYELLDVPIETEALVEVFNACMAGDRIGAVSMGDGCVFIDYKGTTFRVSVDMCDEFGEYVNSVEAEVS